MLRTSDRRPPLRTQRVMSFLATLPAAFSDKADEASASQGAPRSEVGRRSADEDRAEYSP